MQTKKRIYLYRENPKQNLPSLADSWSFSAIRSLRFRPHRFANSINFRLPWWQIVHETLVILNESLDDCQIIWQWFSLQFNQGVFFAYQPLHEFIKECQEILKLFEMILNKNGLLIVKLGISFTDFFLARHNYKFILFIFSEVSVTIMDNKSLRSFTYRLPKLYKIIKKYSKKGKENVKIGMSLVSHPAIC